MKNNGFTLIELLVVIAIIGILVTMIILALVNAKDKAKDVSVMTSINTANSAAYNCILGGGTVHPFNNPDGGGALCSNDITMIWPTLPSAGPAGGWNVTAVTPNNNDNYSFSVHLFDGTYTCRSTGCS